MIRLALLALLSGCGVPQVVVLGGSGDGWGHLDLAIELGVPVAPGSYDEAEIIVLETEEKVIIDKPRSGYAIDILGCKRVVAVWEGATIRTMAHELGHALGLVHVRDRSNVMDPKRENFATFNDLQIELMEANAAGMAGCL